LFALEISLIWKVLDVLAARSVLDGGEHNARPGQGGSCGSGAVLEAPAFVAGFDDVAVGFPWV